MSTSGRLAPGAPATRLALPLHRTLADAFAIAALAAPVAAKEALDGLPV